MSPSHSLRSGALARLLALLAFLVVACLARTATASPEDRYRAGLSDCVDKFSGTGSFSCSICGVNAGCDGNNCYWGGIKSDASNNSSLSTGLARGYQLYCLNSGGSVLASGAPAGVQSRTISSALRGLASRSENSSLGGTLEYAHVKDADGSTFGAAFPVSYRVSPTLDSAGTVILAKAPGLTQVGVNARALWTISEKRDPGGPRTVLLAGVPLQLLVTTGDGLATGFGYLLGGTGLAGIVTADGTWGAGASIDAVYLNGLQMPAMIAARYASGDTTRFAVQPAITTDLTSPTDAIQANVLGGLELGDSIVGVQIFAQGSGNYSFSLGVSNVSRAISAAQRGTRPTPVPPDGTPPDTTPPPSDDKTPPSDDKTKPSDDKAKPEPARDTKAGDPCGAHVDCTGSQACVAGKCVVPKVWKPGMVVGDTATKPDAPGPRGAECTKDAECPGGAVCDVGFCIEPGDAP